MVRPVTRYLLMTSPSSIIGAVVILLGVVFLAWREGLARRAALPIAVPDPKT